MNRDEPNSNDRCREHAQDLTAGRTNESPSPTRLQPKEPPGQRTRKARRFGDEIRRLHAEGYSLESIRETLAEAGVEVSWSTVQREAARQAPAPCPRGSTKPQPDLSASAVSRTFGAMDAVVESPTAPPRQSGKEVAEAFFQAHISNPLLRKDER